MHVTQQSNLADSNSIAQLVLQYSHTNRAQFPRKPSSRPASYTGMDNTGVDVDCNGLPYTENRVYVTGRSSTFTVGEFCCAICLFAVILSFLTVIKVYQDQIFPALHNFKPEQKSTPSP